MRIKTELNNKLLFDVYNIWDIEPLRAEGCKIWDKNGIEYLDFYGGHAVISVGHTHPYFKKKLHDQLDKIIFYSNSIINNFQYELSSKLTKISSYNDYSLFLCNSGAEANENALKLASFHTNRKNILSFKDSFHGRTSGAIAVSDNLNIQSPFNKNHDVKFLPLNDIELVEKELRNKTFAAVIIEPIQGIGGINIPEPEFILQLEKICNKYNVLLIADEVQSGFGRSGEFFAHQHFGIKPDIISMAKGMGNGFPIGGILINKKIVAEKGMLGSTFGGNHLACVAAIAVLDIIKEENLINNAAKMGEYIKQQLKKCSRIKEVRGKGLMIGIEFDDNLDIQNKLLFQNKIFTGSAKNNVLRLLPPLTITKNEIDIFIGALKTHTNDEKIY